MNLKLLIFLFFYPDFWVQVCIYLDINYIKLFFVECHLNLFYVLRVIFKVLSKRNNSISTISLCV